MQVTMQIIREDGFLGLFRGMTPTLAREVPGYFFFFGGYEFSRYLLTPKGKTSDDIGKYKIYSSDNCIAKVLIRESFSLRL